MYYMIISITGEQMYQVWTNKGFFGIKPAQKCLLNKNGDFVGVLDGTLYSKEFHSASRQYKAVILKPSSTNLTGMYHLDVGDLVENDDENRGEWKSKYEGCIVTIEAAHKCGDEKVYRCVELNEYFSGNELELLEDDSDEWKAYQR